MVIGFDASRSFTATRTGTETYSYHVLKELLKLDRENTYRLYTRLPDYQVTRFLGLDSTSGNPATRQPGDRITFNADVEVKHIKLPKLWTQVGLAFEVLENPPDVLFVPAHTMPVIHRPSLKSIVTIHDLGAEYLPQYHQFPQKLYLNRSTEYAVTHATHLIAVSEATKQDLIKRLNADANKISVVHEAYDDRLFRPQAKDTITAVAKKYGIFGPYLLFIGTIQPRKNLERLIEAFSMVVRGSGFEVSADGTNANRQPPTANLSLVLVGKKGWLSEAIYEAPKKFAVESRVTFIDYVISEDLPALYGGAQAFVFPSLFEGFGIPILEAMACGTPVVTSNVSSMPEVAGEAALYVDPNSTDDIVKAMQTMLSEPNTRASLIEKGLQRVKQFSWQKTAKETLEVFGQVYADAR